MWHCWDTQFLRTFRFSLWCIKMYTYSNVKETNYFSLNTFGCQEKIVLILCIRSWDSTITDNILHIQIMKELKRQFTDNTVNTKNLPNLSKFDGSKFTQKGLVF